MFRLPKDFIEVTDINGNLLLLKRDAIASISRGIEESHIITLKRGSRHFVNNTMEQISKKLAEEEEGE